MKEMTVSEFEKSLRAGLGRCVLFLRACVDKEKYRAAVLSACLNDYAYDGQCEGTRAWYTYQLVSCFDDDEYFYSRIQKQLREVLCRKGNNWEFEHLFDLVSEFAKNDYVPANQFIGEIYRELLDYLYSKTPEPYTVDYELQWLEHVCIERAQSGGADAYDKIVADINELCNRNGEYCMDDFDEVTSLYAPKDDNIIIRANAKSERKKKRACGINKIMRDIKRYDNTDVDGEWHSVALDIVNAEDTVFPIEAYMYVYTGLCACCRNSVVQAMHKHGLLSGELIKECEFDCYDETRELAKSIARREKVKKEILQKHVHVIIDRPLGSVHPEHDDIVYEVNYGYAQGFIGGDGEEQDVYVLGVNESISEFDGIVTAVIHRNNDVEDKWVVVEGGVVITDDEIKRKTEFMEKYFDIEILR